VDLEASAMTNAPPVRRTELPVAACVAYVRAVSLAVERLEQVYGGCAGQWSRGAHVAVA